jgi:quinol monooxygenase YgiN
MYIVHRHKTDPRRFFIYEQYLDDGALEAHHGSEHFQHYVAGELKEKGRRLEGDLYSPLGD